MNFINKIVLSFCMATAINLPLIAGDGFFSRVYAGVNQAGSATISFMGPVLNSASGTVKNSFKTAGVFCVNNSKKVGTGVSAAYNMQGKCAIFTFATCAFATYKLQQTQHSYLARIPFGLWGAWTLNKLANKFTYDYRSAYPDKYRNEFENKFFRLTSDDNSALNTLQDWRVQSDKEEAQKKSFAQRIVTTLSVDQKSDTDETKRAECKGQIEKTLQIRKQELLELEKTTGLMAALWARKNEVSNTPFNSFSCEAVSHLASCDNKFEGENQQQATVFIADLQNDTRYYQKGLGCFMHGFFKGPDFNSAVKYHKQRLEEYAQLDYANRVFVCSKTMSNAHATVELR